MYVCGRGGEWGVECACVFACDGVCLLVMACVCACEHAQLDGVCLCVWAWTTWRAHARTYTPSAPTPPFPPLLLSTYYDALFLFLALPTVKAPSSPATCSVSRCFAACKSVCLDVEVISSWYGWLTSRDKLLRVHVFTVSHCKTWPSWNSRRSVCLAPGHAEFSKHKYMHISCTEGGLDGARRENGMVHATQIKRSSKKALGKIRWGCGGDVRGEEQPFTVTLFVFLDLFTK